MDIIVLLILTLIISKIILFYYRINKYSNIESSLQQSGNLIADDILDSNNLEDMFIISKDIFLCKLDIEKNALYLNKRIFEDCSITGIVSATVYAYLAVILNKEEDKMIKNIYKYLPYILLIFLVSIIFLMYSLLIFNISYFLISISLLVMIGYTISIVYNIYKEACLKSLEYLKKIVSKEEFLLVSEFIKNIRVSFILNIFDMIK